MSLNSTQEEYLAGVRSGKIAAAKAFEDLSDVEDSAYHNKNFRELLFAIDALNAIEGAEWTRIFVRGLVKKSDWLENGRLRPGTFSEISDNHSRYGRGEYSISVVLDLIEEAQQKPSNAISFARRTIREHFTGIQPVTEHALFQLTRYFEARAPLEMEDVEMLLHIREETKGLDNSKGFDRFFATSLRDAVIDVNRQVDHRLAERVKRAISETDETTEAEKLLVKVLKERGMELPKELLELIDLRKDRLMGMA